MIFRYNIGPFVDLSANNNISSYAEIYYIYCLLSVSCENTMTHGQTCQSNIQNRGYLYWTEKAMAVWSLKYAVKCLYFG